MLQPSAPLPGLHKQDVLLPKQADKHRNGAAEDLSTTEAFRPRLTSESYIFINFYLEKLRKQPYFDKNSAGMEDGEGRLRKGISET